MERFITSEAFGGAGEAGEELVWQAVKAAFASREVLAYWRYPIFSKVGTSRKEPDILILNQELGMIIVEVKGIRMEQLESIQGHNWHYRDFYENRGNPYQQAENHLFALLGYCDMEPDLRRKVTGRVLIALPFINSEDWLDRGFDELPSAPPIIFEDNLKKSSMFNTIEGAGLVITGKPISDEMWSLLLNTISGVKVLSKPASTKPKPPKSKSKVVADAKDKLFELDLQQESISKQIPHGPQRIRGTAGAGKTIMLTRLQSDMMDAAPVKLSKIYNAPIRL